MILKKLLAQEDANFDSIWELYIAIKMAIKLGVTGNYSGENLTEFCKYLGAIGDYSDFVDSAASVGNGNWNTAAGDREQLLKVQNLKLVENTALIHRIY